MNNSYYETLDENFTEALNLIDKPLSHEELIQMLENGNIPQRQLAALRLEGVNSKEEAFVLLNNLVGQDGKIREAVSLKIKEMLSNEKYRQFFIEQDKEILTDYFLAAIIDINGNICRNILDSLEYLYNNQEFSVLFIEKLTRLIFNLVEKIKEFDFKDGKYKVNKEVFKLYWCLEAVNILYSEFPMDKLKEIILFSKDIDEYTIREKIAKILTNDIIDNDLIKVKEELRHDKNYYVRRAVSE